MMHLTPEQVVDVAEACADASLAAHAQVCEACRAKVESVRDAVRLAAAEPPEPSPLFWSHLAARIGDAVRRERIPIPFWRAWGWRLAPIGAFAVLVMAVAVGMRMRPVAPASDVPVPSLEAPGGPAWEGPVAEDDPMDDPSWILVSALSAEVSVEDAEASGALPPPGGADQALLQLDLAEQMELARILREELGARAPAMPQGPGA